ncbi:MAG: SseB family protein [Lachnospiraceae bacterium]|nr:SseB family protein [Lachnospiraceae bacterium]
MTKAEKIDKLRNLTKAYVLYSTCTRLPYIECEQGSFYDQAFLFEAKEDAEEAARNLCAEGNYAGAAELGVVEMPVPAGESEETPDGKKRKFMRNQIREHLMRFPLMGLNAVYFKPAGEEGEVLDFDSVLPNVVKEQVDKEKEKADLSGLQLTGMYFAQYLRRKNKDMQQLQEYAEEFHANLVRANLFLPVIPEEGSENEQRLNLMKCRLPYYTLQRPAEEGAEPDKGTFLALFTNMDEVAAHCRKDPSQVRIVRIPFEEVPQIMRDPMMGCVIDPLSLSIPVRKDDIPVLVENLKN